MIKHFDLIAPLPNISPTEFHDYYRHPHGTLGLKIETMRGYVQSHQIHSHLLGPDQSRFWAVAEGWFDTIEDASGFDDTAIFKEHLLPDAETFIDMDQLITMFTIEEVLVSGPDANGSAPLADRLLQGMHLDRPATTKLLHFEAADGGLDGAADLAGRLGAYRHVRCRPHPEVYADDTAPFSEVHELWWPTVSYVEQGAGDGAAVRELDAREGCVTLLAQAERFI